MLKNPQNLSGWIGSGTQLTDLFLQVNINGDVALLKAIMKLLLDEEKKKPGTVFDHDFINQSTHGASSCRSQTNRSHSRRTTGRPHSTSTALYIA